MGGSQHEEVGRTRTRLRGALSLARIGSRAQGGRRGSRHGGEARVSWRRNGADRSWRQWLPWSCLEAVQPPTPVPWGLPDNSPPVLETSAPTWVGEAVLCPQADVERMIRTLRVLFLREGTLSQGRKERVQNFSGEGTASMWEFRVVQRGLGMLNRHAKGHTPQIPATTLPRPAPPLSPPT